MKTKILLIILIGFLTFCAMNYHFILFDDQIKILRKSKLRFENTFVDARGANILHIFVMPDLIQAGIQDLVSDNDLSRKDK